MTVRANRASVLPDAAHEITLKENVPGLCWVLRSVRLPTFDFHVSGGTMSGIIAAVIKSGALKAGPIGLLLLVLGAAAIYVLHHRTSVFQGLAVLFGAALVALGGVGLIVSLSPLLNGARTDPAAIGLSTAVLAMGLTLAGMVHLRIARERREKEEQERKAREEAARLQAERERLAQERRDARSAQSKSALDLIGAVPGKAVALFAPPTRIVKTLASRLVRRENRRT